MYTFNQLFTMLSAYETEHPSPVGKANHYFIDQSAMNQWEFAAGCTNDAEHQALLVETLRYNLRTAGNVLICLSPWDSPIPFSRTWCLFELFEALNTGVNIECIFDPAEAEVLRSSAFDFSKVTQAISVERAQASVPSDKALLMRQILETIGVSSFDAKLRAFMHNALRAEVLTQAVRADAEPTSESRTVGSDVSRSLEADFERQHHEMKSEIASLKKQLQASMRSELQEIKQAIMNEIKLNGDSSAYCKV